jgi:uncharacterized membrane protein (DUF4010 family)
MEGSPVMVLDLMLLQQFFIALLIGALIGLEREKKKASAQRASFSGIRTFILLAQMGAVSAWLSQQIAVFWLFPLSLLAIALVIITAYVLENKAQGNALGLTSELAAITVFLLGGAVMYGYAELAVMLAIVTSAVLAFEQPLHGLVARIDQDDLYAGIKLLIASFIVLPLLPNTTIDPWQALNPYKLWLLVILISALSLSGYVAMRLLGPQRGTLLMALTGGIVSSTAVTLSLAKQSHEWPDHTESARLAAGIFVAWLVMVLRVTLMLFVLAPALLNDMWWMLLIFGMATLVVAWYWWRQSQRSSATAGHLVLTNPFSLWSAIKFGLFFAVVLLLVNVAKLHAPNEAMLLIAALAGATDVDAIALSMMQLAGQGQVRLATLALMVAICANSVVKTAMVVLLAAPPLRYIVLRSGGVICVVGALVCLFK